INNNGEPVATGAAWYGPDDIRNIAFQLPQDLATPEAGELAAILETARATPKNARMELSIKASKIIKLLTKDAPRLEQLGWIQAPNTKLIVAIMAKLRERSATTTLQVWGTNTPKRNMEETEHLIRRRTENPKTYNIHTKVKDEFNTSGLLMSRGTQSLFYKGICGTNNRYQERRLTRMALAMTHHTVREISLDTPSEAQIWKSIRSKDIPKGIHGFLWKNLHGAYRLGEFWQNIPNCEHRGTCRLCGGIESMEHILVECEDSPARKLIWELAEKLWCWREDAWPNIRFGTILGCNLAHFTDTKKKRLEGKSRLFSILTYESAHLIWKLRCKRVIKFNNEEDKFHSKNEICNRWISTINRRLKYDKLLTNTSRYGKKALRESLVLHTWSGVLLDEDDLPDNWIRTAGVLVGILPQRFSERNG
ncbi:ribonuclease H-like protein, partial [Suillus variegatus]